MQTIHRHRRAAASRALLRRWWSCAALAGLMAAVCAPPVMAQTGALFAAAPAGGASGAAPVAAVTTAPASPTVASEDRVKAASLYKFLNYISWPPAAFVKPDAPYVIGVIGADEVADNLEQLVAGHRVSDRLVQVRRLHDSEVPVGVHVVFVGKADRNRLPRLLRQVQGLPVLVVTEGEGGTAGGMINFRIVDERVRFEVALEPVEKAGLKLDSRMLAVALSVSKGSLQ